MNKREDIRLLMFSASLRKDSLNTKLITLASKIVAKHGGAIDLVNINEFEATWYNQDLQDGGGFPSGIEEFKKRILESDAIIISSPEYNGSLPGHLKNIIDWTSRFRPQPFNGKHALLLSASPSMGGGNKGLWQLRIPLESLGVNVFPNMFSLAVAHNAFDENGNLADNSLSKRFENNIVSFMNLLEASKHYHCIKSEWAEFLGEKTDAQTDRVE